MIKIKQNWERYLLYVDNIELSNVDVVKHDKDDRFSIYSNNLEDSLIILDYEWDKLPSLDHLSLRLQNIGQLGVRLLIDERTIIGRRDLITTFSFDKILAEWKGNYSFNEYLEEYEVLFQNNKINAEFERFDGDFVQYEITFEIPFESKKIIDLISEHQRTLINIHEVVEPLIRAKSYENTFLGVFNFPEALKIPCEQYLLYFAQFLQDLGINATSNLTEEAGKVLFSVTPTDDIEALDKIREALAVYLNLPSSPIVYDESFAAMRLQQQVENLQHSQKMAVREIQLNEKLLLAQSDMIREKNVTISQQQSIIEKLSNKSIMIDSAENKEELEEVYKGIKVGKSESLIKWLGLHLNLATVIKEAVKNTLGKGDKIIELQIDDTKKDE